MTEVLGIIPARQGSKRLPGKNLLPLGGKPLVAWTIEAALRAKTVDRWVVSSNDEQVLEVARCYGADLPLRRPDRLAGDRSPAIEYVRHALCALERDEPRRYAVVVILQPSSPLTQPADIDGTVGLLLATGADSAVSVVKAPHDLHPFKFHAMEGDRLVPFVPQGNRRMAAHEVPDAFVRNGAVYATRRAVVDSGAIIGADCRGYPMPRSRSVDINEELDYRFAEFLWRSARAGEGDAC